jgi:Uma2 family endonuclease
MTLEEFREAEEQPGYLYELARGVLDVTEVPGDDHGQIVDNLHQLLSVYRTIHPNLILRIAHGSDLRLLIPELVSDRHPDLAVVFRKAPKNARGLQIPALVVEVVSAGSRARKRDYEEKPEEYRNVGIREHWIVDPSVRRITVLSRSGKGDRATWVSSEFQADDSSVSPLLPGFDAKVSEVWRDVSGSDDANGD